MKSRPTFLHQLGRDYVTTGLAEGNFDAIPYDEEVTLRAPLCPGGSAVPLKGKANLREKWFAPLPDLVVGAEVLDTFVNCDLSAVAVAFLCHIRNPACTLRVMDRFEVNEVGLIVSQENFFDPRDITTPGWQTS